MKPRDFTLALRGGCHVIHVLPFLFLLAVGNVRAASVTVVFDDGCPQAAFAAADVRQALSSRGHRVRQSDLAELDPASQAPCVVLCLRSDRDVLLGDVVEARSVVGSVLP